MQAAFIRKFQKGCPLFLGAIRFLTTQEVSAALRPFYFTVHPDLFGQHPKERAINEESLKTLSEYVKSLQVNGKATPTEVIFYLRYPGQSSESNSGQLKRVTIRLTAKTLRDTVVTVLSSSGLSLEYLNTIPLTSATKAGRMFRPIQWHSSYYAATDQQDPDQRNPKQTPQLTLKSWLLLNIMNSRKQASSITHVQEDINRLCDVLHTALNLQEIRWDSVWGVSHFRGCLKSFYRLYSEHPHFIKSVLKDRKLVFSNTTGVSRLGEIVLSSEDVPAAWMKLLITVRSYDAVLERLPYMEDKLSELLNGIRVVRHERLNSQVMAEEYELLLNKLLNSLRRCQDYVAQMFRNKDLSGLEMIVEGESGPLTLSSTGSFLIPASCPGVLVVDFISQKAVEAHTILKGIDSDLQKEEECVNECLRLLELKELTKDEGVTPEQMISCCQRLTSDHWQFSIVLHQSSLRVSHYYSVMQDGQICIPWNWVGYDT